MSRTLSVLLSLGLVWVLVGSAWGQANRPQGANPNANAKAACLVSHFRAVALGTHDVELRASRAEQWLTTYSPNCTLEQLNAIKGNSSSWLGHALTPQLSGIIEGLVEAKIAGKPESMAQMYESVGKEGKVSNNVTQTPTPRPPVTVPSSMQVSPVLLTAPVPAQICPR